MKLRVKELLRLAVRLQDVKNLFDETLSVSPHTPPGLIDNMQGGPQARKFKHQKHDAPQGPRGVASIEEESEDSDNET